jgi:hypothetical protein
LPFLRVADGQRLSLRFARKLIALLIVFPDELLVGQTLTGDAADHIQKAPVNFDFALVVAESLFI